MENVRKHGSRLHASLLLGLGVTLPVWLLTLFSTVPAVKSMIWILARDPGEEPAYPRVRGSCSDKPWQSGVGFVLSDPLLPLMSLNKTPSPGPLLGHLPKHAECWCPEGFDVGLQIPWTIHEYSTRKQAVMSPLRGCEEWHSYPCALVLDPMW